MNIDEYTTIIPKGTKLYHGTGESFDIRTPRPGGYDEVFWTSNSKDIARSYISHPSGGTYTNPRIMLKSFLTPQNPDDKERITPMMTQLGITSSLVQRARDMVAAHNEKGYEIVRKTNEYKTEFKSLEKDMDFIRDKERTKKFFADWKKWEDAEEKYVWWYEDKLLSKLLVKKLKTLFGYDPTNDLDSYDIIHNNYDNWQYKLHTTYRNGKEYLLPADYSPKGKLLTIIPQRDMKFFDFAKDRDGDLMDVDYHNISLFRKVEEKGFDGIIINDFAQTVKYGNYGHKSWGFFKKTLKDVKVVGLQGQTAPSGDLTETNLIKNLLRRFK